MTDFMLRMDRLRACERLAADTYVPPIVRKWAIDRLNQWREISETDKWILSELAFSYHYGLELLYNDISDRR